MAENPWAVQSQNLLETFANVLTKTSEELSINQLLAFMSLSNTMGALNLLNGSPQRSLSIQGTDSLSPGLTNMLGPGGGKPNLMDLVGMLGNAMGQQGGQGKLNPQMLLSLLNMLSQLEPKKKFPQENEKGEDLGGSKGGEESKDKFVPEKK